MDLKLAGKTALVTGASTGIGRATALVMAREGAAVVCHGRNVDRTRETARLIAAEGGTAWAAIGDLATDAGAAAVAQAAHDQAGSVDILVNNIGGTESTGPTPVLGWFEVRPEHWAGAMEQNLISAVRMIHAFVPAMRERGWGRVINVSSGAGAAPPPNVPEYSAAKAGIANLTVGLSRALSRTGVTVNTVSPGCTRTEMLERTLTKVGDMKGWPDDMDERERLFMAEDLFPCSSARFGRPEEVAALIAFIASPLAGFVNGANYRIDGGQVQAVN
jgi:NAD(P)-dependent dehydrogenase (short-subunit alcohol dehydrogenase family)